MSRLGGQNEDPQDIMRVSPDGATRGREAGDGGQMLRRPTKGESGRER